MGMNKIIVNHIEKLFVTNDAATIIREMEPISSFSSPEPYSPTPNVSSETASP